MVVIGQKDFNQDMGEYLSKIRKQNPIAVSKQYKFFSKRESTDEDIPVQIEYEKPGFFRRLFAFRRRERLNEEEADLDDDEIQELEELESEIESIEAEEDNMGDFEDELEQKRESLVKRLFSRLAFFKSKHEEVPVEEEFEEIEDEPQTFDEEVKEVLKITHTWLEKLTPRYKKEFKASEDFLRYKDILIKHGLAKEKEPIKNK